MNLLEVTCLPEDRGVRHGMMYSESRLGKIAIMLVVALCTSSTQCVAECVDLPSEKATQHNHSAPPEGHHHHEMPPADHHQAPPSDHHDENSHCDPQVFLSDAVPQTISLTVHALVMDIVTVDLVQSIPQVMVFSDPDSGHSPPPPTDLSARTILRV